MPKFDAMMTFDIRANVSPAQVQRALFRAIKTRAFGLPGSVTIHFVEAVDVPPPETTGLGPTGPADTVPALLPPPELVGTVTPPDVLEAIASDAKENGS